MRISVLVAHIMMLLLVVGCRNESTKSELGRKLCANTEAFLFDDSEPAFAINPELTERSGEVSVPVLGAKINQLNKRLGIPMTLEPELIYPLYIHKSLKKGEGNVCLLTGLIRIEFDGDQRELILLEISENEITPIAILGAELSFAECTMSIYSHFVEEDFALKKVNSCMEEQANGEYKLQVDTITYPLSKELLDLTNNQK